jgi:hypothetical protein
MFKWQDIDIKLQSICDNLSFLKIIKKQKIKDMLNNWLEISSSALKHTVRWSKMISNVEDIAEI